MMIRKLWSEDAGFIVSAELVIVATIVVIGMIVGLTSLRNQVVQELVDVGQSVGALSQSFAYTGTSDSNTQAWTDGGFYTDKTDLGQQTQEAGAAGAGISVSVWPNGANQAQNGGEMMW